MICPQCLGLFPSVHFGMRPRVSYMQFGTSLFRCCCTNSTSNWVHGDGNIQSAMEQARVSSNQELSCYMVFFKYHWIQSLLGKGRVWMNGWGNICVTVLCRYWRLFRHIFIASFKVPYLSPQGLSSAFTGTFPLWNSLFFTSSFSSTTSLPLLSRSFVPFSAARRALSLSFLGRCHRSEWLPLSMTPQSFTPRSQWLPVIHS